MQTVILTFLALIVGIWCGCTIGNLIKMLRADAQCPHCGTLLLEDDTTYINFYDDDTCETVMSGHCPNCHKNYTWITKYKKHSFKNLEEVK